MSGPSPEQMGIAGEQTSQPKESRPVALDKERYEQLKDALHWDAYGFFNGDAKHRTAEFDKMLADKSGEYIPTLDYPDLEPGSEQMQKIEHWSSILREARNEIREQNPQAREIMATGWEENDDPDEQTVVDVAYLLKINEKIAETELVKAAARGDMKSFERMSGFIYGEPSPEIFQWTVDRMRARMKALTSIYDDPEMHEVAQELLADLPEKTGVKTAEVFPLLDKDTFKSMQKDLEKQFDLALQLVERTEPVLIDMPPDKRENYTISPQSQRDMVTSLLEAGAGPSYTAEIIPGRTGYFVNVQKKVVEIPDKRELNLKDFRVKVIHEVLTHVYRRTKGTESDLMLLGVGLKGYDEGEEGVASFRERLARGEQKIFFLPIGHFAIGLARGVDGKKRNPRQVHRTLSNFLTLQNYYLGKGKKSIPEARKRADIVARGTTIRTFRGTDGKTPGVCLTKDIIYTEGRSKLYRKLKQLGGKATAYSRIFNWGKFDAGDSRGGMLAFGILRRLPAYDKQMKELGIAA